MALIRLLQRIFLRDGGLASQLVFSISTSLALTPRMRALLMDDNLVTWLSESIVGSIQVPGLAMLSDTL